VWGGILWKNVYSDLSDAAVFSLSLEDSVWQFELFAGKAGWPRVMPHLKSVLWECASQNNYFNFIFDYDF
jgi:hypothetical protein